MFHWIWSKLLCWHNWVDQSSGNLTYYDVFDRKQVSGRYWIQECSKCKSRRLIKVKS